MEIMMKKLRTTRCALDVGFTCRTQILSIQVSLSSHHQSTMTQFSKREAAIWCLCQQNPNSRRGLILEQDGESPRLEVETPEGEKPEKPVVCARGHSLRHYGKVKDPIGEYLLPESDLDHTVGRRLASISGARSVVLLVVDASDFDGSFPRKVAKLVSAVAD